MISVYIHILKYLEGHKAGSVFATCDFMPFGSRDSVDQALSTLVKNNIIVRLCNGIYSKPKIHKQFGIVPPNLLDIIQAISRSTEEVTQISGAQAANDLGFSLQVPMKVIVLTSGKSRVKKVGSFEITFKHASPKTLLGAGTVVGDVIQALKFMGKEEVSHAVIHHLKTHLSQNEIESLYRALPKAPIWSHKIIKKITEGYQHDRR